MLVMAKLTGLFKSEIKYGWPKTYAITQRTVTLQITTNPT